MTIKEILCKSLWLQLTLISVMGMLVYNAFVYAGDAEEWVPDANLRQAVREALELSANEPLTKEKMLQLTRLHAIEKGIVNMCHHPQFDIDENCMIYGMALLTNLAML